MDPNSVSIFKNITPQAYCLMKTKFAFNKPPCQHNMINIQFIYYLQLLNILEKQNFGSAFKMLSNLKCIKKLYWGKYHTLYLN